MIRRGWLGVWWPWLCWWKKAVAFVGLKFRQVNGCVAVFNVPRKISCAFSRRRIRRRIKKKALAATSWVIVLAHGFGSWLWLKAFTELLLVALSGQRLQRVVGPPRQGDSASAEWRSVTFPKVHAVAALLGLGLVTHDLGFFGLPPRFPLMAEALDLVSLFALPPCRPIAARYSLIVLADIIIANKVVHTRAVAGVAVKPTAGWPNVELTSSQLSHHWSGKTLKAF